MKTRLLLVSVFLALLTPMPTLAADTDVTFVARYRQDTPVTLDLASASEISSLDSALVNDSVSIVALENLFLGLTDLDPVTHEIRPEVATSWDISDDGLTWTFHLRDDVMWMHYDPETETAEALRPVVAEDFVYGIQRACDPRLGGYYGTVIARVIAGCNVINLTPSTEVTDNLVFGDTTQVRATDVHELEITLNQSAGYFLSMTTMWPMFALPHETIREHGDEWTQPGNIITNGPYMLHDNIRGIQRAFVRNQALPDDLHDGGNIERIIYHVVEDGSTVFGLYQANSLDITGVPAAELQAILADPPNGLMQIYDLAVFYFGFMHAKPPFDNIHARRAFSAIIDREAFIQQIRQGRGVPMIHFTPPGMLHAPPIDEIGVGYNPDYAREQMALAGYPDCENFPSIDIITYQGAGTWAEFWAAAAERELGCDPGLFNVEQLDFSFWPQREDLRDISNNTPLQDLPHAMTNGSGPDYPDSDNWMRYILHCEGHNLLLRSCTAVDTLIEQAATETDQTRRAELYRQIEEAFFGPEGEFPVAPIYMRASYILVKPWYTGPHQTDGLFGGPHWNAYTIDMAAKLAARGE